MLLHVLLPPGVRVQVPDLEREAVAEAVVGVHVTEGLGDGVRVVLWLWLLLGVRVTEGDAVNGRDKVLLKVRVALTAMVRVCERLPVPGGLNVVLCEALGVSVPLRLPETAAVPVSDGDTVWEVVGLLLKVLPLHVPTLRVL